MNGPGSTVLKAPQTPQEWQAYHDIRRVVLFEARGRHGVYDPDHPDDRNPRHYPLLLSHDGEPIGTIRIDHRSARAAILRLVAVRQDLQGRGHGRRLVEAAERFIIDLGCRLAFVNAALEARDFYRRLGYGIEAWDPADGQPDSVQMVKRLRGG